MNNIQKYFGKKENVQTFYSRFFSIPCSICPASKYCRYDTQEEDCRETFVSWAMTKEKGSKLTNLQKYCNTADHIDIIVRSCLSVSDCIGCPCKNNCDYQKYNVCDCDQVAFPQWCLKDRNGKLKIIETEDIKPKTTVRTSDSCEYCKKKGKTVSLSVKTMFGMLPMQGIAPMFKVSSTDLKSLRINKKKFRFCPMCGRKL